MKTKDGWRNVLVKHKIQSRRHGFGKEYNLRTGEGKTKRGTKFHQKAQCEDVQRKLEPQK